LGVKKKINIPYLFFFTLQGPYLKDIYFFFFVNCK